MPFGVPHPDSYPKPIQVNLDANFLTTLSYIYEAVVWGNSTQSLDVSLNNLLNSYGTHYINQVSKGMEMASKLTLSEPDLAPVSSYAPWSYLFPYLTDLQVTAGALAQVFLQTSATSAANLESSGVSWSANAAATYGLVSGGSKV